MSLHPKPQRPRALKAIALGHRIACAREQKGYTQPELAAMIAVSAGAVGQYEVGITAPRLKNLEKIALALEVSLEWLLTGDDPDELVRAQTVHEKLVLSSMRTIPADQQATAVAILDAFAKQVSVKK